MERMVTGGDDNGRDVQRAALAIALRGLPLCGKCGGMMLVTTQLLVYDVGTSSHFRCRGCGHGLEIVRRLPDRTIVRTPPEVAERMIEELNELNRHLSEVWKNLPEGVKEHARRLSLPGKNSPRIDRDGNIIMPPNDKAPGT